MRYKVPTLNFSHQADSVIVDFKYNRRDPTLIAGLVQHTILTIPTVH